MSDFVVRIELHGAPYAVYENLHTAMQNSGYSRYIKGTDGVWYQLPPATYVQMFPSKYTAMQVHDHVKPIAGQIWSFNAVFVARYDEAAFSGLNVAAFKAA